MSERVAYADAARAARHALPMRPEVVRARVCAHVCVLAGLLDVSTPLSLIIYVLNPLRVQQAELWDLQRC